MKIYYWTENVFSFTRTYMKRGKFLFSSSWECRISGRPAGTGTEDTTWVPMSSSISSIYLGLNYHPNCPSIKMQGGKGNNESRREERKKLSFYVFVYFSLFLWLLTVCFSVSASISFDLLSFLSLFLFVFYRQFLSLLLFDCVITRWSCFFSVRTMKCRRCKILFDVKCSGCKRYWSGGHEEMSSTLADQ